MAKLRPEQVKYLKLVRFHQRDNDFGKLADILLTLDEG